MCKDDETGDDETGGGETGGGETGDDENDQDSGFDVPQHETESQPEIKEMTNKQMEEAERQAGERDSE